MIAQVIASRFVELGGSQDGAHWLALLWDAIQGLDDWRDGDPVSAAECERVIHVVLHDLPASAFFRQHAGYLLPHLSAMVLKWRGANAIEEGRDAEHYPHAFMWRAGFYDVVLMSLALCIGPDAAGLRARDVAATYGETLNDFTKETDHA